MLLPAPFGPTIVVGRLVMGRLNLSNNRIPVPDSEVMRTGGFIHDPGGDLRPLRQLRECVPFQGHGWLLSDVEWAQVAAGLMDKTELAPAEDHLVVLWVGVRHAADHIHLVATLGRQDGARPTMWNDFYRVREACQAAEVRFGLRATAPAERTAARCPARSESERRGRCSAPPAGRVLRPAAELDVQQRAFSDIALSIDGAVRDGGS